MSLRPSPQILRPLLRDGVDPVRWDPCADMPGFFLPANDEAYYLFWAMMDTGTLQEPRPTRPVAREEIEKWAHQLCIIGD